MSSVNKFIADASLFTAVSLFSQLYSCRYWLIGRLTVNRHVISFFHSPVLRYAVVAFHSVVRSGTAPLSTFHIHIHSIHTHFPHPLNPILPSIFHPIQVITHTHIIHTSIIFHKIVLILLFPLILFH